MKIFTKALLTSSLSVSLLASGLMGTTQTHAAKASDISIMVNNETPKLDVSPYIKNGATLVPLSAIKSIPDVTISWDNKMKVVTVTNDNEKSTLKAGSKEATINGDKVALPNASEMKNGRIMVPIRFITDASDAYAYWNSAQRIVYVAKPSDDLKKDLQSSDTATSRNAAIRFPTVDRLGALLESSKGDNMVYTTYFSKNKVDEFMKKHLDVVNYYRIIDGRAELVWTARLDLDHKAKNANLPIVEYKILESKGKMPVNPTSGVYFSYSLPGGVQYGTIDKNGKATELPTATAEQSDKGIFDIPEEEQLK